MIPETAKKVGKKVLEYVAFFAAFGTIGTYWINTEVERRMNELAIDPAAAPAVVALTTEMENVKEGQAEAATQRNRIETKVDAFSRQFIAYLERQAE